MIERSGDDSQVRQSPSAVVLAPATGFPPGVPEADVAALLDLGRSRGVLTPDDLMDAVQAVELTPEAIVALIGRIRAEGIEYHDDLDVDGLGDDVAATAPGAAPGDSHGGGVAVAASMTPSTGTTADAATTNGTTPNGATANGATSATKGNGAKSNGAKATGAKSNGTKSNGAKANGTKSNGAKATKSRSQGSDYFGGGSEDPVHTYLK